MATVVTSSGSQHEAQREQELRHELPADTGYGGRSAEEIVLPVRIIMSPTSSSRFLAGSSARCKSPSSRPPPPIVGASRRQTRVLDRAGAQVHLLRVHFTSVLVH